MMEWLNLRRLLLHILVAFICVGSFKATTTTSANNSGNITTSRTITTTDNNNSGSSSSTANKDNDRNVQYENIVIKLMDNLPKDNCQIFLTNLEVRYFIWLRSVSLSFSTISNSHNRFSPLIKLIQFQFDWLIHSHFIYVQFSSTIKCNIKHIIHIMLWYNGTT